MKRKPLSERVEWRAGQVGGWTGKLAGVRINMFRNLNMKPRKLYYGGANVPTDGKWIGDLHFEFEADSLDAAKAEALRIVQRAVLQSAAEWSDTPELEAALKAALEANRESWRPRNRHRN